MDEGTQLASDLPEKLCTSIGMMHLRQKAHHFQTNNVAERFKHMIINRMQHGAVEHQQK